MKKALVITLSVILVGITIIGILYAVDMNRIRNNEPVVFSTWGTAYAPPEEITPQLAVEIVKKTLDKKSIQTITNFDNPKVEEVIFESEPSIAYFGKKVSLVGKNIYKITFNTTVDGLLGPIVTYVDKASGELIGCNYRY